MTVLELRRKEKFIPWYEKMVDTNFTNFVVNTLMEGLNISKEEALQKFEEFQEISIFDESCKYSNGTYSFRYYVMKKLQELSLL